VGIHQGDGGVYEGEGVGCPGRLFSRYFMVVVVVVVVVVVAVVVVVVVIMVVVVVVIMARTSLSLLPHVTS